MALFTGRMARISCIAMGGEVWFERHESTVVGRYFCSMAEGVDRVVIDPGHPAEGWRSPQVFGRIGQVFLRAGLGQNQVLADFLGARTT
jgi:hypothetical protein